MYGFILSGQATVLTAIELRIKKMPAVVVTDLSEAEKSAHIQEEPRSTALSVEEDAAIAAFRRYTLLPLDDCLYALRPTIPHLTRSSLHRRLQRHGVSRLQDVEDDRPAKKKFKSHRLASSISILPRREPKKASCIYS